MVDLRNMTIGQLANMPARDFVELEAIIDKEVYERDRTKLYRVYPDKGPLRRELYPKHLLHMAAGKKFNERALLGGNRSGKTFCCCYEIVCHMMGYYPSWWEGFRFQQAVSVWSSGEDTKAVRESLQPTYLGAYGNFGTGLVPAVNLLGFTPRSGVPEAVDAFTVKHVSGGTSRLLFKSYDQGRESFQASKVDIIQFDEEPPQAIYSEGLTRTLSTVPGRPNGLVVCGFTPLKGLSGVVLSYVPGGQAKEGAVGLGLVDV